VANYGEDGMNTSLSPAETSARPAATAARVDEDHFWLDLTDGRILGVPFARFPALARASAEQRRNLVLGPSGRSIHWPELDEDIGVELLLYYTPPA
jgi:hypothetical protein